MYVDDSTLHTSATTATEMTATLNKELQFVSEWVARNKLALNISRKHITTSSITDIIIDIVLVHTAYYCM